MIGESSALQKRKQELRIKMLAMRRALSTEIIEEWSASLVKQIISLQEYKSARRIMAFLAMKGEANLDRFIRYALQEGKEIYIPVCKQNRQMEAGRLTDMNHFQKGPMGLRNLPDGYSVLCPKELDLVLIPAVACSPDYKRLGMGAGYYDRFLSRISHEKRVAVIWDFQMTDLIPVEPHDEKVAKIVTEKRII